MNFSPFSQADAGKYKLKVTNPLGNVETTEATVTVDAFSEVNVAASANGGVATSSSVDFNGQPERANDGNVAVDGHILIDAGNDLRLIGAVAAEQADQAGRWIVLHDARLLYVRKEKVAPVPDGPFTDFAVRRIELFEVPGGHPA